MRSPLSRTAGIAPRTPTATALVRVSRHHVLLVLGLLGLAAGCGTKAPVAATDSGPALRVVSTVSPITSIVDSIVVGRASVQGLVPEGANSHTFEPLPSAATAIVNADAIFVNGLQLEVPIMRLAEANKKEATPLVALGDSVLDPEDYRFDFSFPRSGGSPNPHLWTDPSFVVAYAEVVAQTMTSVDPDGADIYQANLDKLRAAAEQLDVAMTESFATIPADDRVLLTYHDAYAYFADNYGFEVIGAVQPASFGDPSPRDVAALIEQVRQTGVPAIFGSEVFPSPVLDQIAVETGGTFVGSLRDDDLPGLPGEEEHTWFGLLRLNYVVMTEALGGDASALLGLPALIDPGTAEYPQ